MVTDSASKSSGVDGSGNSNKDRNGGREVTDPGEFINEEEEYDDDEEDDVDEDDDEEEEEEDG